MWYWPMWYLWKYHMGYPTPSSSHHLELSVVYESKNPSLWYKSKNQQLSSTFNNSAEISPCICYYDCHVTPILQWSRWLDCTSMGSCYMDTAHCSPCILSALNQFILTGWKTPSIMHPSWMQEPLPISTKPALHLHTPPPGKMHISLKNFKVTMVMLEFTLHK